MMKKSRWPSLVSQWSHVMCVVLLLGICIWLRIPSLSFQLPDLVYGDEAHMAAQVIDAMERGDFTFFRGKIPFWYGPFYCNILLFVTWIIVKGSVLFGHFQGFGDFPQWAVYYFGRCQSLLFSLWSVLSLFIIGKRFFSWRVGLIAPLVLIMNFHHVRYSCFAKPDTLLVFLSIVVLWLIFLIFESKQRRLYFWSAFVCGLGIATKLFMLGFVLPVILAMVLGEMQRASSKKEGVRGIFFFRSWGRVILGFLIGYCLGNIQALFHPILFYQDIYHNLIQTFLINKTRSQLSGVSLSWSWFINIYQNLVEYPIILYGAGLGWILCLFRYWRRALILLVGLFSIQMVILPATISYGSIHHYMIMLPAIGLLFGIAVDWLAGIIVLKRSRWVPVQNALVLIVGIYCIGGWMGPALRASQNLSRPAIEKKDTDPRVWFYQNIPLGSKIVKYKYHWPFLSKYMYQLDSKVDPDLSLEQYAKQYDYLILHHDREIDGNLEFFSDQKDKLTLIKSFPQSTFYRYGFDVYDLKSGFQEEGFSYPFQFKLSAHGLKQGDFAGIKTFLNHVESDTKMVLKIYDGGGEVYPAQWVAQRVTINDQIVWDNDIGGDAGGWNTVEIPIHEQDGTAVIFIEVCAISPRVGAAWSAPSETKGSVQIFTGMQEIPVSWQFVSRNGEMKEFKTFYTQTLHPDRVRHESIQESSFEEEDLDYWALLMRPDIGETVRYWLSLNQDYPHGSVFLESQQVSDGDHSLRVMNRGYGDQYANIMRVGQVIPWRVNKKIKVLSVDWFVDLNETQSEDYEVNVRVLAESIGGQFLREKVIRLCQSENDPPIPGWNTMSFNLRDEFSGFLVDWNDIAFLTIILETVNKTGEELVVYFDHIRNILSDGLSNSDER